MAQTIFISYRRADSAGLTRALYDRLAAGLPSDRVYLDVETIEGGDDFRQSVANAISGADVLLVMIGPEWVSTSNTAGRRLDDPNDLVRVEVATALGAGVRVIPVLLDGAPMPRPLELPDDLKALTARNALEVRTTRFDADATHLIRSISGVRPAAARLAAGVATVSAGAALAMVAFANPSTAFFAGLVALGAVAALAARRAFRDSARLAGRPESAALTVVLPLFLFGGLTLSGMTLNRDARAGEPFTLVVETQGDSDETLAGSVSLNSRSGDWEAPLGPDGRAVFTRLPSAALGDTGNVIVAAEGFEPAETRQVMTAGGVVKVTLARTEVVTSVRGTVLDATGRPLGGVVLDFGSGLATDTTDAQGNYGVSLPLAAGRNTVLLATFEGQVRYRDLVVVPSGSALTIRFRPDQP